MTGPPGTTGKVRRDPRQGSLGLAARYRVVGGEAAWRDARLYDLSVGGAFVACTKEAKPGQRWELRLARLRDGLEIEVAAEVTRVNDRSDGKAAAVRFLELKKDAAATIAAVLDEELAAERAEEAAVVQGLPSLSSLRLHDISLYDLLELDPACHDGAIESRCEELIESVEQQANEAVGRREERLRILHNSLVRMRPLWNDPVKRARYDLRWGYVRAEQRLLDAESGAGVHAHVLSGIWFDLYPDSVREAEKVMARPRTEIALVPALKQAIELDPFNRRRRQRLAMIESPPEPDAEGPSMPPPGEAPMVRGSLSDVPLRGLLRAVAEDEDDAEIVVRVAGKAIGVVGFTRGDVVTAICGRDRGLAALRLLAAVREGTFQARYAAPRVHLRHMREPALQLLEQALTP